MASDTPSTPTNTNAGTNAGATAAPANPAAATPSRRLPLRDVVIVATLAVAALVVTARALDLIPPLAPSDDDLHLEVVGWPGCDYGLGYERPYRLELRDDDGVLRAVGFYSGLDMGAHTRAASLYPEPMPGLVRLAGGASGWPAAADGAPAGAAASTPTTAAPGEDVARPGRYELRVIQCPSLLDDPAGAARCEPGVEQVRRVVRLRGRGVMHPDRVRIQPFGTRCLPPRTACPPGEPACAPDGGP